MKKSGGFKKAFDSWKKKKKKQQWSEMKFGPMTPQSKKKLLEKSAKKMSKKMTSPEKKMSQILSEMHIEYETQKILGSFIYDFYVDKYRLFIEVDGDYFHAHPEKYDKEDLNADQEKSIKHDDLKNKLAKGLKYEILRFWESDIESDQKQIKKAIREFIKQKKDENKD